MKKRTVIQFSVTPRQKRAIVKSAKLSGLSVSAWLRWVAHVGK